MSGRLWVEAPELERIVRAPAVVLLIGSYDGSINYGDVLQLDAALRVCGSAGSAAPVLTMLELQYLDSHRDLMRRHPGLFRGTGFIYFEGKGPELRTDGEKPEGMVPLPVALPPPLVYLYGGGYLNELWGQRKASMLELFESVARRPPQQRAAPVISSGHQVSSAAVDGSCPAVGELLARCQTIGVRDPVSLRLLCERDREPRWPVAFTGDDAAALIAEPWERNGRGPTGAPTPKAEPAALTINLHLSSESYVTSDSDRLVDWVEQLVEDLRRSENRSLDLNLIVAYEDRRVSERPILEELARRVRPAEGGGGSEVVQVRILNMLEEILEYDLDRFRAASLTIACSYHVALTTLLGGRPVVHLSENAYYRHKARGLQEQFGLPDDLLVNIEKTGPDTVAEAALRLLADEGMREVLRRSIERGAEEMLEARRCAETDIVEHLDNWEAAAHHERPYVEDLQERFVSLADDWTEQAGALARLRREHEQLASTSTKLRREHQELRSSSAKTTEELNRVRKRLEEVGEDARRSKEEARRLRGEVRAMRQTRAWRLATRYRAQRDRLEAAAPIRLLAGLRRFARARSSAPPQPSDRGRTSQGTEPSAIARRVVAERLTYLSEERLRTLERCAVAARSVPGDYVEAGVALGGSSIVLASLMPADRRFHGFDVFGMIPPTTEQDGEVANARYAEIASGRSQGIGGDPYYGYEDDLLRKVKAAFERFELPVDGERIVLHRGPFEATMTFDRPIALAHVDGDWYASVKTALERIYPWLSPGGFCIVDDYRDWSGCTRAVDEFLEVSSDMRVAADATNLVLQRAPRR